MTASPSARPRVDVWRLRVDAHAAEWPLHWSRLDAAEQQRAAGYQREADRLRFVIGRSTLRDLLGRRLGMEPARVVIVPGTGGKPGLPSPHRLEFNTSHSGDWVLHALSVDAPVGIDVEAIPTDGLTPADLDGAWSTAELADLHALPPDARAHELIAMWTCKEAYVKALGEGLGRAFAAICIRRTPAGGFALVHDFNVPTATPDWCFASLALDPRHAGCVASPGQALDLRVFDDLA